MIADPDTAPTEPPPDDSVFAALRRLDVVLEAAVDAAETLYGATTGADPFRGLHISREDVTRDLAREPGVPLIALGGPRSLERPIERTGAGSLMLWLAETFGLSDFDLDVMLLALAPEIDLRYGPVYAYLQDDIARRRPSVDLALNLFCATREERLAAQQRFTSTAPLVAGGLLSVSAEEEGPEPPLLARRLKLDDQVVRLLLGRPELDERLAGFCEVVRGHSDAAAFVPMGGDLRASLAALVQQGLQSRRPVRIYLRGPRGSGKRRAAATVAADAGLALLVADLPRAPLDRGIAAMARLLLREAAFGGAILYLSGIDTLGEEAGARNRDRLLEELTGYRAPVIVGGAVPARSVGRWPDGVIDVSLGVRDVRARREDWRMAAAAAGIPVTDAELDTLAGRFRLTPGQIGSAAGDAARQTELAGSAASEATRRSAGDRGPSAVDRLLAAARNQSSLDVAQLAQKVETTHRWDDIVLPADTVAQLQELCSRVDHGYRVLGAWRFDRKLSRGRGANALFAGPAGTGKTMAAEIIAAELRLDLYRIDLAGVVSKYIGETEKNLDRIFTAAEGANAILLFDEADALFGKRSEVRDSHDRYANIEISYLLQRMELYEGVAILSTNLAQNLDEAFVRRLAFMVHFPFPDRAMRRSIWARIWPADVPLAEDVDLDLLAERCKFSGGNIRNVALAAAFLAAGDGKPVGMGHLVHAARREYQKMGKALSETDLGLTTGTGSDAG